MNDSISLAQIFWQMVELASAHKIKFSIDAESIHMGDLSFSHTYTTLPEAMLRAYRDFTFELARRDVLARMVREVTGSLPPGVELKK